MLNDLLLDENNMAFNPSFGNSYKLNDSAREIINLLKEGKEKDEILNILSNEYGISKDELFVDLSDFLTKLKIYGLLQ